MAWINGIFQKFLQYWTKSEKSREEKPSFWEEILQTKETAKEQNNKEIERIFYRERKSKDSNDYSDNSKEKSMPIFQRTAPLTKETKKFDGTPIFLQAENPALQREKERSRQAFIESRQIFFSNPIVSERIEGFFSPPNQGKREKKKEKQRLFRQAEKNALQKEFIARKEGDSSVFLAGQSENTDVSGEKKKSPIVREMEQEYRTEALLQQIVQYAGQNTQESRQQKISVQIGQVQKSADVDMVIEEITRKLWEARSVGRCNVERR